MAVELSEGEDEGNLVGDNQLLIVDDNIKEIAKKAAWSVSSHKPGNGVSPLRLFATIILKLIDLMARSLIRLIFNFERKAGFVLYMDFKLDASYTKKSFHSCR